MKITAENYEQWALDYLEGTLSPQERAAFERFLETDSRAAEQLRALEKYMPVALAEKVTFPDPASLMRNRSVTPLRRLLSLVSGAAAAAAIAGIFILLDPNAAPTTGHRRAQIEPHEAVIAETLTPAPSAEALPIAKDALPRNNMSTVSTAAVLPKSSALGPSRLAEWNRKTSDLLKRMKEREERHREPAKRDGNDARTTPATTPSDVLQPAPNAEGLLAAAPLPERKAAFMMPQTSPSSSVAAANQASALFSLLPPDATTPILSSPATETMALEEEHQTREYWLSDELRPRREGGLLRSLLSPIEKISPIKYYRTEEARGVEIASILRIGSRNN